MAEFVRMQGVVAREVAGELVLISTGGSGDFFVLNDAGRVLWDALATPCREDDLARRLTEEFAIEAEIARADAAAFLAEAVSHGVVQHTGE